MNIPAYICQSLCIGRTYDARNSSAGIDIFPSDIPTKTTNINKFTFKYKKVQNSKDVKDLLDISGELSLKVKVGLVKAEGSGKYLSDSSRKEGTTEILAVLKYFTVTETMDGIVEPVAKVTRGKIKHGLGTHYVRSVRYGAEMTASLSINTSSDSKTDDINGNLSGDITLFQESVVNLKSQLKSLASQSRDQTDIAIQYYATCIPAKSPTNLDDLVDLIQQFPSTLKDIDEGRGIPLEFELLPINTAIQTLDSSVKTSLVTVNEDFLEQCFDDVRDAQDLVHKYNKNRDDNDEDDENDVLDFSEQITQLMGLFRDAISLLNSSEGKDQVDACLKAYKDALDGRNIPGKFCKKWKNIFKTKKPAAPPSSIKLPKGKPLTVVLLGKTGNGKSATGNSIVGRDVFEESDAATSVTTNCAYESRIDERQINVIDTPGIMDTKIIEKVDEQGEWLPEYEKDQERVLREVAKVFGMAPYGLDAIALVVKYGCRFTVEDAQAFKLLQKLFGEEAEKHMFLLLTFADQATRMAEKENVSVEDRVKQWTKTLPSWVQEFVQRIGENRVLLFDNTLEKNVDASKKQVSRFIQNIDKDTAGPLVHKLTKPSRQELDKRIKEAMKAAQLDNYSKEELEKEKKEIERQLKEDDLSENARDTLKLRLDDVKQLLENINEKKTYLTRQLIKSIEDGTSCILIIILSMMIADRRGGCFPGSATFVDKHGLQRKISSIQIGEEVQVIINNRIITEPVITFIHRQPEVMQEFLKITTLKKKILKITEDHLMFVEKEGQAAVIPARDVSIGDTMYVKGDQGVVDKDAVQSISTVIEKGVYAPVTLSGTILVNDVHTSCYFDVLSHKWSHRAMGAARAVYHVSPWMLQWVSSVGEKDGFPGWCRLAHKMLTLIN